jgi:ATP-dependent helicase Lhr and Lhr-like helicase
LKSKVAQRSTNPEPPLTDWLADKGWTWFPHQLETLKAAREGKDVLLCAPTGAGKTLSGFLPAFDDLVGAPQRQGLHTLYISPLKALTVDVHRNVAWPIEELHLPITYETRTGDTPASKRARQKIKPPDMLMTTPESLALLISYDNSADYFRHLRFVIIDELHALMPSKRGDLLSLGLARLRNLAPHVQCIGLSATIPDPGLALAWMGGSNGAIVKAPMRILPKIRILESKNRIPWSGHMASYAIAEIYQELTKNKMSIVFVNTRAQAELVFQNLWKINDKKLKIALHHGSLEVGLRRKVEENMAQGLLDCVVATSSLDLGIDWADVDLVVQIGAPKGVSRLLQRIGRSNHRMNEPSRALLVPTNRFECIECQATVDAIAHKELDGTETRKGGLDVLAQHVIGTACAGPFDADSLYEEVFQAWPYRKIARKDFDAVLNFVVDGGYVLRNYERFQRLKLNEDGKYQLTNPRFARQYRMNIGTIVEAPMLKVKRGRQYLGMIEEWFINNLAIGDTFLFAGSVVQFDSLRDGTVMVSKTQAEIPKIPSYDGGKLPLSTHLSLRVREMLESPALWKELPQNVESWLELQQKKSLLPGSKHLLVEVFPRQGKYYMALYPFAGRNAHQTLGFLLMRRMKQLNLKPLSFVATDYALVVTSFNRPQQIEELLSVDLLGEDLEEWLEDTPLLKRTFREAAVIAGIVERRHPGQQKTGRQMTFSSDLIYDVLMSHEPNHILLRAARQDAMGGLIAIGRLSQMLTEMQNRISVRYLDQASPLAVPLLLQIAKESVSRKEAGDYYLEDLEKTLLQEIGLTS